MFGSFTLSRSKSGREARSNKSSTSRLHITSMYHAGFNKFTMMINANPSGKRLLSWDPSQGSICTLLHLVSTSTFPNLDALHVKSILLNSFLQSSPLLKIGLSTESLNKRSE